MNTKTFKGEGYHAGAITRVGERTFYCKITVDLHTQHSASQTAVERIYTDALLSGAGTYTRDAFIDAVSMLGASIGIHVSNSKLTISVRSLDANTNKVLKLVQTMLLQPTFDSKETKRTQGLITNELIEHKENAKALAVEFFVNELYTKEDRRYTDTPDILIAEVKKVSKPALQTLHAHMLSQHWTVTVSGSEQAVQIMKKTIEHCKKNTTTKPTVHTHAQKAPHFKKVLHNVPSKQNIEFAIGSVLPMTLHHPDYLPFVFGLNVLGKWGGFTGRLMSTVREKEGLTYGIYAQTESVSGTEQGHWRIMTFFAPDKALQGLTSTVREVRLIAQKGITQKEYERFQSILQTQQRLLADSLTRSADTLHGYLCNDFSLKEIQEYQQRLLQVTRKEINHALHTYLNPDTLVISGAGPITNVKKEILNLK